jgi:hypothetical protein
MQSSTPQVNHPGTRRFWLKMLCGVTMALGLLALSTLPAMAQQQDAPPGANLRPWEPPADFRFPDKNDQMEMQQQHEQQKQTRYAAANLERQKQIAADTARLVELANELKAQVDKTNQNTMSLDVIRKADAIEKLAKGVKEKMKLTIGGS